MNDETRADIKRILHMARKSMINRVTLTSQNHTRLCVAPCPGISVHDVLFYGTVWSVDVPACHCHEVWREAHRTIIHDSGIDFIGMVEAKELFHHFAECGMYDSRLDYCKLRLSKHNLWFVRSRVFELYTEKKYFCDLCHKSVKPEEPQSFDVPKVVHISRKYRDDRVDYYYECRPGQVKKIRACKHCVRYRLPRERKDVLWQQSQAENRKHERELIVGCKSQMRALKKFLKEGNPEVLQSLPKEFGPAEISPTSCPRS